MKRTPPPRGSRVAGRGRSRRAAPARCWQLYGRAESGVPHRCGAASRGGRRREPRVEAIINRRETAGLSTTPSKAAPTGRRTAHDGTTGASDLHRVALIEQCFRNVDEKARRTRCIELAIPTSLLGVREIELALRTRDTDVEQPSLFLELRRIVVRARQGEKTVF